MLHESLPADPVWIAGAIAVAIVAAARVYAGPDLFGRLVDRLQPYRRALLPYVDAAAKRYLGDDWYTETTVSHAEHVATLQLEPGDIVEDLEAAGYEPQALASVATDWRGRTEVASYARYYGPKPFPGAPDWLRARQVHVRLFRTAERASPAGPPLTFTVVTAHAEANPWRPDRWRAHYDAEAIDVDEGRELVADDLGVHHRPYPKD